MQEINSKYLDNLFEQYVPNEGPAKTVLGELIRAYNNILYSWSNNGEPYCCGNGVEETSPTVNYLITSKQLNNEIKDAVKKLDNKYGPTVAYTVEEDDYENNFMIPLINLIEEHAKKEYNYLSTKENKEDSTLFEKLDYKAFEDEEDDEDINEDEDEEDE